VVNFLKKRGYAKAEEVLKREMEGGKEAGGGGESSAAAGSRPIGGGSAAAASTSTSAPPPPPPAPSSQATNTLALQTMINRNAPNPSPNAPPGIRPLTGNPAADQSSIFSVLLNTLPSSTLTALNLPGPAAAALERERRERSKAQQGAVAGNDIKILDPSERVRGYEALKEWVEASLECWKPELRPLVFPVFVHVYLDLIATDFNQNARGFFNRHARDHVGLHAAPLRVLSKVGKKEQMVGNGAGEELVKRFRSEKYVVRMSRGAFGLLVGWLSSGGVEGEWDVGGGGAGGGGKERGKEAVRGVVNERIKIDGESRLFFLLVVRFRSGEELNTVISSLASPLSRQFYQTHLGPPDHVRNRPYRLSHPANSPSTLRPRLLHPRSSPNRPTGH
jgi:hypothetical protein